MTCNLPTTDFFLTKAEPAFLQLLSDQFKILPRLIYTKAEPAFLQLLSDQYGNYLSQKILEHCSDAQFDVLFNKVEPQLASLANEVEAGG